MAERDIKLSPYALGQPSPMRRRLSGGNRRRWRHSLAGACLGFALLSGSSAIATPVTRADLSDRKFCWNDGGTENYYADGAYVSTNDGKGTWSVTDKGVQITTNQISGLADMQKLEDGSFTATWLVDGKPKTWTGHYCE